MVCVLINQPVMRSLAKLIQNWKMWFRMESEAAADSVGVLYYHGEANLVDALLHARLSCFLCRSIFGGEGFLLRWGLPYRKSMIVKIHCHQKISDSMQARREYEPEKRRRIPVPNPHL